MYSKCGRPKYNLISHWFKNGQSPTVVLCTVYLLMSILQQQKNCFTWQEQASRSHKLDVLFHIYGRHTVTLLVLPPQNMLSTCCGI